MKWMTWACAAGLSVALGCATATQNTKPAEPAEPSQAVEGEAAPTQNAPGEGGEQVASATQPAEAANPDEVICSSQKVVGSNLPRRVCRTRRQLEEERRAAQQSVRDQARTQGQLSQ